MSLKFPVRNLTIFLLIISFSYSCTRITTTDIGGSLIPAIDGVNTLDTIFNVESDIFEDTDTIKVGRGDLHMLGQLNDPQFGSTNASIFFETLPPFFPYTVGQPADSIKADSAILMLSYKGFYGDSTQPLNLSVYEINNAKGLSPLVSYPSGPLPNPLPVAHLPTVLGTQQVDIRRMADSINTVYEKTTNMIRIKLPVSIATRLLKQYDTTNAYKSDSSFRTYFGGLAIKVNNSTTTNALLKIALNDANTKLGLYYRYPYTNPSGVRKDTSVALYYTYTNANGFGYGHANFIERNRSTATGVNNINNYLSNNPATQKDSILHVQTGPGTFVRIRIPGLKRLSSRIIHRAELIAEQVPDDNNLTAELNQLLPPNILFLGIYDSLNKRKRNIPNDFQVVQGGTTNINTFGGILTYRSLQGYNRVATYQFNISRYIQGIITRNDNEFDLRFYAPVIGDFLFYSDPFPGNNLAQLLFFNAFSSNDAAIGRVRLGGGNHSKFRLRLRIIYSRT
ncbi:MAG TPA: hypothetical protein DIW54_14650 [Chitinophagaceae bacterium]|nr:hypothetical protein [Chitinophagaceae bacterium]